MNKIIDISPLKDLYNLEYLRISDNNIRDIKPLYNLDNLRTLDLSRNQISDITAIKKFLLKPEIEIAIHDNLLDESFFEIIEIEDFEKKKILLQNYFLNLEKASKPLNEAKLMILGEGNAGKSNLRNYLLGLNFDDNKSATVGIAIDRWKLHKNDTDYRINIWDFGGQWLQQQVHKFFITNESLYVILLKARTEDSPNQWLEWIKVYAPNSKAIVVVNRIDELNGQAFSLTENSITKEYPFVVGFHYVSLREANLNNNIEAKLVVDKLRMQIEEELTNLPNIHAKTPLNYFNLKTEIEDNIFVDRPFISIEYFEELVKQKDIVGDTKSLLNVYDRIGTLRYFKNTSRFILNPEWLSAGVYKLITNNRTEQLKGVVKVEDFPIILQKLEDDKFEYSEADYGYLREMMDVFNLAYIDPTTKTCFIPKQFEKDIPTVLVKEDLFPEDYIYYYFQYEGYFPDSLISQFIAKKYDKLYKNYYWQQGIVLQDIDDDSNGKTRAYVRADANRKRIEIKVKGENKRYFFKEIKKCLKDLQKDIAFDYKEMIVDIKNDLAIDYKKILVRYNNGKKTYDEITNDDREIEINIAQVLGTIQQEWETEKEAQTIIHDNRKTINYHIKGDYHNKGRNYNNAFNFYDYADGYTDVLDELDKASKNLPAKESEELVSIIHELVEIPNEVAPEKSKNLFTKALERLKNFPKTIDSEGEKLVAKELITASCKKLQDVFDGIDWDRIIKLGTDLWDKGKELL
jgi:internalin A